MDHLYCHKNKSLNHLRKCRPRVESPLSYTCKYYDEPCQLINTDNGCFTFNAEGNFTQQGDGSPVQLDFYAPNATTETALLLFVNHFDEPFTRIHELSYYEERPGIYWLDVVKEVFTRLPAPYPNKCHSPKAGTNYSTTRYNRLNCYNSCVLQRMFDDCGAIIDFSSKDAEHMIGDIHNYSEKANKECLHEHLNRAIQLPPKGCSCPYPCFDITYNSKTSRAGDSQDHWKFNLKHEQRRVIYITELPLKTVPEALSNLGGIKSLLLGTSVLSFVELVLFVGMVVVEAVQKLCTIFRQKL